MSQIGDNDDNHSITASDFVQFGQSGDFVDSQKHQQQQQRFGYQNQLDWTMNPGSPGNYGQYLKELNLKIAALEAKNQQTLQSELEKVELKAENRALKEKAKQMADNQALQGKIKELEDDFANMFFVQKAKNRVLEEKLCSNVGTQAKVATTDNRSWSPMPPMPMPMSPMSMPFMPRSPMMGPPIPGPMIRPMPPIPGPMMGSPIPGPMMRPPMPRPMMSGPMMALHPINRMTMPFGNSPQGLFPPGTLMQPRIMPEAGSQAPQSFGPQITPKPNTTAPTPAEYALMLQKITELELKLTSLEETHQKEIAIMKMKNQETEAKAQVQINKLEQTILNNQQKLEDMEKEIAKHQQKKEPNGTSNKGKRLDNPLENRWYSNPSNPDFRISAHGFCAKLWAEPCGYVNIFAEKGFSISGENYRVDQFARNSLFYYEVTKKSGNFTIFAGLSDGEIPDGSIVGNSPNSYAPWYTSTESCYFKIAGMAYEVEVPSWPFKPIFNGVGDVFGCGIILDATNKMTLFFTFNGILLGKQIPIASPPVDCLYPTVSIYNNYNYIMSLVVEANFGHNPANPFKYDIVKCPGLVFH